MTTSKKKVKKSKKGGAKSGGSDIDQVEAEAEDKWKDELLEALLAMSPAAFEKLAQRLLREYFASQDFPAPS